MIKRLKHLSHEKRLRHLRLLSPEKRRPSSISSVSINTCREGTKEMEPGSFQWCPVTGLEATGTSQNSGRFSPNIRKHFFTERVIEHWCRLRIEVVESPSLDMIQNLSGHSPG